MTLPLASAIRPVYIPQLGTSTSEDSKLTTLIASADAALAGWCEIPEASAGNAPTLEAVTYTHYLDGPTSLDPTGRTLLLPVAPIPVTSITSIYNEITRTWTYSDAADLVDSGDYTLDGTAGAVYLHHDSVWGGWYRGIRRIQVIYVAGYDTGADERITRAIGTLVAHWWQQRNTEGLGSVTMDGTSLTPATGTIPAHVQQIMWPIRRIAAGVG